MMATFKTESREASIGSPHAHGSKDSLLDGIVTSSECHVGKTLRCHRVKGIACAISKVTIDVAAGIEGCIDDIGIEARVAVDILYESIIVMSEGQSFGAA